MALPVPNLDDRRFQDLVDDAKRLVQQKCPEWTDHNVSDPGVTLIETFAWMTDQVLSRLASALGGDKDVRDHTQALEAKTSFYCFDKVPKPDDVLLIGLSEAVPSCAVTLRFRCDIEGVGVDPENPPLLWEAWDGYAWS